MLKAGIAAIATAARKTNKNSLLLSTLIGFPEPKLGRW
jgi:hypothetical protein